LLERAVNSVRRPVLASNRALLAQIDRSSSDNVRPSVPWAQNCRAASRASFQTSRVSDVTFDTAQTRGGTCVSDDQTRLLSFVSLVELVMQPILNPAFK
jgi:hypothetical protein